MPHSIEHLITPTPKGVKVDLKTLYVYPDGHANLTFEDGTNWPIADEYELIELLAGHLLRPMQKRAKRLGVTRKAAESIVRDFRAAPGSD